MTTSVGWEIAYTHASSSSRVALCVGFPGLGDAGAQPLNLENDQNDELTNHVSAMLLAAGSTCENPNA